MNAAPDFSPLEFRPFRGDDRLLASLGPVSVAGEGTQIVMRLDPGPGALNPGGFVHGGTLSALFDVALYEAAKAGLGAEAVTVSLDLKFLLPGAPDLPLTIVPQVLRAGRSLATVSGQAFQGGRLIAFATGQFAKTAPLSARKEPA